MLQWHSCNFLSQPLLLPFIALLLSFALNCFCFFPSRKGEKVKEKRILYILFELEAFLLIFNFSMATLVLLLLLLLLTSPLLSNSLHHHQTLEKQASILLTLKQSFYNSQRSPILQSWNSSSSLCDSWLGVQCDHTNTHIVSLDISNSNISGSVSPIVSELESLTYINIADNCLSGEFPPSITNLSNLVHLNISNNEFNGTFGWNFASLVELQVLDAYNNNFSGSLPPGVTDIPRLRHLDFGGNYFSGPIPMSYGEFKEISFLSLAGNSLCGFIPREISNLTSLKQLYLGYFNDFDGGIPVELGSLINLVHLDLASCGLDGEIPLQLGNLKILDTLYLQTNQLIGTIPVQLGNLSSLKFLDLSNNALTGEIPSEFSRLRELSLLSLFMNRFHGEIPVYIAEFPRLEVLRLFHNNFTGSIPAGLGKNGRLRDLDLSTNKLTGLIPKNLCFGKRLEILILFNNFLFGPLPDDLGDCYTISRVRMGQNYLSGSIPRGFLYLPVLELLELQNNYLTGMIAEDATKKPEKLSQLNLSNNRLFGQIPTSFGNFSALINLLLSDNKFSGKIPHQLGLLKRVQKIDLSQNNLSDTIPRQIGDCSLLTSLDLSRNQLVGPIPNQISQIRVLNYLNVSWNQLNQSIPKEIGSMKSLTAVDFSHNLFCGFISNPCNVSSPNSPQPDQSHSSTKSQLQGKFKLAFALGLLTCSILFAAIVIIKTRSMMRRNSNSWKLTAFQKLGFNSEDIAECIKENSCIIGKGGAGIVYRGTMPNGDLVAVKKLLGITKGSSHDNGFSAEIQTLGKIRHRNIVRLLAVCSNREAKLLVYEYMQNGSLGEMLHGKRGGYLNWGVRVRIALEAARGLCYLHHDCCPPILHRDVKSNNILLDGEFEAHVADFGLAKFLRDTGASECMSAIAGSYGYIAPEYAYTLKVDEKSDVYSFGVVILELVTGKRPVGDFEEEGIDIVQWAKMTTNWSKEGVVKILDRRLTNVPLDEAMQMFFVGMLCVQERSLERPTMREVVQMLEQVKQPCGFRAR